MLKHLDHVFEGISPSIVLYCYGVWQDLYDELGNKIENISFHQRVLTQHELDSFNCESSHRLIILDDLMSGVLKNQNMEKLFTQGTHHKKITSIFLSQNIFQQGSYARSIMLNIWYLILFRNMRDASQVNTLARQMFPGNTSKLLEAYQDSTTSPFGYLVIDMSPHIDEDFRLRTNIFPGDDTIIYT